MTRYALQHLRDASAENHPNAMIDAVSSPIKKGSPRGLIDRRSQTLNHLA